MRMVEAILAHGLTSGGRSETGPYTQRVRNAVHKGGDQGWGGAGSFEKGGPVLDLPVPDIRVCDVEGEGDFGERIDKRGPV